MAEDSQYIVSARKYRPDSFEDLIGQDNIVKTLKNSIIRGKLAHAYLFCGPRGVGKTSAARIFAKTINCSEPTADMEPCGHCESCISFREGRSFCIHEMDAASNNSVEDMKVLMEQVQIPPQVGKYSVYIIDEVHMLSTSAFNAFLKTLEEPPAHAIFILATTEKHKILPTILSRCQTYDFNRISISDIVKNLKSIAAKEGISADDESLHVIARKADGAMRDALTIFDQTVAFCGTDIKYGDVIRNLNVLDYEHCFHLTDCMLANDYGSCLLEFDRILAAGFNALYFVASLSEHFRNLMIAGNNALDALLEFPDTLKKKYQEQAGRCPMQFLYDALTVTSQCESGYKESVNPRLHIEFALMKLCFLIPGGEVSLRPQATAAPAGRTAVTPVPRQTPAAMPAKSGVPVQKTASDISDKTATEAPDVSQPTPITPQPSRQTGDSEPESHEARPKSKPATSRGRGRQGTSKAASALSLSAIQESSAASSSSQPDSPLSDRIPEDDEIVEKWRQLPNDYISRPRLYTTLSSTKILISQKDDYKLLTFFVISIQQKKWLEEVILRNLESKIQAGLKSSKVRLAVEVIPEEVVEKKIYMPEDKAKAIIAGNEEIAKMVKDLHLEVK